MLLAEELKNERSERRVTMCGDATNWDEDAYRETVLREREIQTRTVFRTAWAPPYTSNLDTLLVASSDGSVASYSISSSVVASKLKNVRIVSIPSFFLFFFSSIQVHTQPILFAFNYHFTSRAVSSLFLSNFDGESKQNWLDRKSTRLNSSHYSRSRMPSSA